MGTWWIWFVVYEEIIIIWIMTMKSEVWRGSAVCMVVLRYWITLICTDCSLLHYLCSHMCVLDLASTGFLGYFHHQACQWCAVFLSSREWGCGKVNLLLLLHHLTNNADIGELMEATRGVVGMWAKNCRAAPIKWFWILADRYFEYGIVPLIASELTSFDRSQ